ncbi:MAG: AraC family transcriptional regulator [Bacteroidaceae bacterium]|nr:AraC family transcriptional regulator [Bacteroidaceae bacterium]
MIDNITPYELPDEDHYSFFFFDRPILIEEEAGLHQHDAWELTSIAQGYGTLISGDEVRLFKEGDTVLMPPKILHQWIFDPKSTRADGCIRFLKLAFRPNFLSQCLKLFPEMQTAMEGVELPVAAQQFQGQSKHQLRRRLEAMSSMNNLERVGAALQLLPIIFKATEKMEIGRPKYIERNVFRLQMVSTFVMKRFRHKVKLEEVAREVGMNRSAFCTWFKQQKGITFNQFLTDFRITTACGMLRDTDMQISQIGCNVGYDDLPHFIHIFSQHIGMSPSNYRKQQSSKL